MTRIDADWLRSNTAQRACAVLTDAGQRAWFVGGCVRNTLMGLPATDIDIATDALPQKVMTLAKESGVRAVPTGIDHGTVTLVIDGQPFEITTLRRDIATDGRRAVVAFADTLVEDASRRDFTMNALYAEPDGRVMDPLGGLPDLQARHVRFIDDPAQRIREDYLRILRFFRFTATYGDVEIGIDPDGLAACAAHSEGLKTLSKERVGQEIRKLLSVVDPAPAVAAMFASGVMGRVLPGSAATSLPVLVHIEQVLGLAPDPIRRLAVLGGEGAAARLRLSKAEARKLDDLKHTGSDAGELGYRFGYDAALDILATQAAMHGVELDTNKVEAAKFGDGQTLPVDASDYLGDLKGPAIGKALSEAEARWIASGFALTRDELLA